MCDRDLHSHEWGLKRGADLTPGPPWHRVALVAWTTRWRSGESDALPRPPRRVAPGARGTTLVLLRRLRTATGRGRGTVWQAGDHSAPCRALVEAACAQGGRSSAARCARNGRISAPTDRQPTDWRHEPGTRSGPAARVARPAYGCMAGGGHLIPRVARPQTLRQGRCRGTKSASSDAANSLAVSSRSSSTRADSRQPYQTRSYSSHDSVSTTRRSV